VRKKTNVMHSRSDDLSLGTKLGSSVLLPLQLAHNQNLRSNPKIATMLPTPSTSHVCFDRVYEPAEDSYLLLDTLSSASETAFLRKRSGDASPASPLVLEVGVGSGVVLAFLAANAGTIFGRHDVLTLGTDINSFACKAAIQTIRDAIREREGGQSVFIDVVNGDLASAIRPHSVDVFIFNPPYVPAELPDLSSHEKYNMLPGGKKATSFEQDSYLLELSYAGGEDGMVVTNRMLEQIPGILSADRGVAYVLLCAQNKPDVVKQRIREWGPGWMAETVGASGKKAGWEKLVIVRIWRNAD
jgi:release factor glutamine methyltransferase